MDEQILSQIKEFLPDLKNALEQGIAYGGDLFHRFVMFSIWEQGVYVAICLILLIPLFWFKKAWKYTFDNPYNSPVIIVYLFEIVPLSVLIGSIINIIKLVFIPELYLFDTLSKQ